MPLADIFNQRCEARNVKAPESCAERAQPANDNRSRGPAGIYVCGMMVFPKYPMAGGLTASTRHKLFG
jgi:hypothetical protein